jgi:hypothetical protein
LIAKVSKTVFVKSLVPVASAALQDRYIRRATAEEYFVPDELLKDAIVAAKFVQLNEGWVKSLTPLQREQALSFAEAALRFLHPESLPDSTAELLEHPAWVALRESAASCLASLGYALSELERDPGFS